MGIGDRAYMRNQRPAREPISATAWVVGVLVAFFILNLIQESAGADLLGWAFAELPGRHVWPQWHAAWNDSIAHSAHLGGLLFGWLAYRRLNQTNLSVQDAPRQASSSDADDARSIARDAYAAEENSEGADNEVKSPSNLTKGQARAELDMLLDKISAGGFGSLTVGEKRRLEELSARLR